MDKHKLLIAQEGRQTSFLIPPLRLRCLCRVVLQSRARWQGVTMRLASVSPSAVRLLPRRLFTTTPGTGDAHRAAAVRVPSRRRLHISTTAVSAAPAKRPPTNSSANRSSLESGGGSFEPQEAVHTALAAQQLYQLPDGRSAVPLLLPTTHSLPFGMALELVTSEQAANALFSPIRGADNAYHLYFVMCGGGLVGGSQVVSAGDSVLGLSEHPRGPINIAATNGGVGVEEWDLVLLRVVFPSAILEMDVSSLEAGPAVEGTARYWLAGTPRGETGPQLAADLLEGAKKAAQQGLEAAAANLGGEQQRSASRGPASQPPVDSDPTLALYLHHRLNYYFQRHHAAIAALEDHTKRLLRGLHPGNRTRLRRLTEVDTFQLPNQTNLLALVFDPLGDPPQPFTFGIEVFQTGHETPPHKHDSAYEVFFILSGSGVAFCDDQRFEVSAGDTIVFPPKSVHGIDNSDDSKMYLLELMLPNDAFAEFVREGQQTGLEDDDLCVLIGRGCGGAPLPKSSQ